MSARWSRREWLQVVPFTLLPWTMQAAEQTTRRPLRVAAINSVFYFRSHAYHILGRLVHGYDWQGVHHQPAVQVVRMYNDQAHPSRLAEEFCRRHQIALCPTAEETLGGARLDVDAVALIIEHGNYPLTPRKQVMYPRYEYFARIVDIFRQAGRSVPVFVDKHLSYDHRQAAQMMQWADELQIPLMAGSSLPVTWRIPELEVPRETRWQEGVVTFGYDRGVSEVYLIHALEALQCFLERRRGGETGIAAVQWLEGDAVWRAGDAGEFSWDLVEAALARAPSENVGPLRENVRQPQAILVRYRDGTRGCVLNLIEQTSDFCFAGSVIGRRQPLSTCLFLPSPPGAKFFDPLTWHIERFFETRQPPYPAQRTWLTSTVLDLALQSAEQGSQPVTAAALDIRYQPPADSGFARGSWIRQR
ncbi:MAG: hypothetical protein KatS3mg114_0267 [Planctomycetaceae bacterium]|nr:MAG: hypothetical protein KatS3mg114_0267 [Planctomycetaceae bacterium]